MLAFASVSEPAALRSLCWSGRVRDILDGLRLIAEPRSLDQRGAPAQAWRRWAQRIRLAYEVEPLAWPRRGGEMR